MTRLVLVRHGESAWNAERRVQGQGGTGLSELGHAQAQATAAVLARLHAGATLVTSDLQRCLETAAPLGDILGVRPRPEPGLRERDFGTWSGMLVTDVAEHDPQRWERWRRGEDVVAEVGGEDTPTLVARVVATLEALAEQDGSAVICVTHGGPIWHGTHALLDLPPVLGGVANCAITEIEYAPERARLVSWNQVAHLPPPPHDGEDSPPVGT